MLRLSCVLAASLPAVLAQTIIDNTSTPTLGAFDTTGSNLTLSGTATGTASGVISGTGSLTHAGTGTWTLTAANTFTGTTTVSAGTLSFSGSGGLANSAVTIEAGAILFTGAFNSATIGSISGAGAVAFSYGGLYAGGSNASTTFSGSISNSGTLVKTGTGTLTFNGSTPGGGQLSVSGGTLIFAPSSSANYDGPVSAQSGGTLIVAPPDPSKFVSHVSVYSGGSATIDLPNSTPLGTTDITVNSGGALTLSETYKTTALAKTTLYVEPGASLSMPSEGVVLGGLTNYSGGTITINPTGFVGFPNLTIGANNISSSFGGNLTFTGAFSASNPVKIGTGTWTLNSAVNFAPLVTAGYVALDSDAAGTGIQLRGGGLRYNTSMTHTGGISPQTGGGTVDTGSNNVTVSGTVTNGSTGDANALIKVGSGKLTLSGNNNFVSVLAINAGTVAVSQSANLGVDYDGYASAVRFGGGTLSTTGSFTSEYRPLTLASGGGTFEVASGTTVTWNGAITGASGNNLTKTGAGTLVLNGANTYAGTTTISFGTIKTGHTTALGIGPVTVSGATAILALNGNLLANTVNLTNGGTLSGSGSVGTLSASSGGQISPGNSPGTITAGTTTFGPAGKYVWEINDAASPATSAGTRYDLLSITGALNITATSGSPFAINLTSLLSDNSPGAVINFNSSVNSSYTIATASGGITGFSTDKFSLNTTGFTNAANGGSWSVTTLGNDLNLSFTTSAIPEPSTYAALLGAAVLVIASFHRRRK